ncbi:MAG: hypothetical protein U0Z26_15415 [Anaerolineales bacterium]
MQCPKCKQEDFETNQACPQCGFQAEASQLEELYHLEWLVSQMKEWDSTKEKEGSVSKLKETYTSRLKETQVSLGLRLPSFTSEEAESAWVELANLEILFEKVEEWRSAGYFKAEMEALDPVKTQRAYAEELSQRLEEYQRPEFLQTDQNRLKTASFLLDQIDLLASRQWFKKKELEHVVAPITALMLELMEKDESTEDGDEEQP